MITLQQMIACGIGPTQAKAFEEALPAAMKSFDIDNPLRMSAFIAQASFESQNFTRLEEDLYYTTVERLLDVFPSRIANAREAAQYLRRPEALANHVYCNKLGNGDEASGEGWKYRGRGLFQLTGRANYMAAGDGLGADYKAHPELVAAPPDAAFTAAWYWATGNLNVLADAGDIDGVTRRINGKAMLGKERRRALFDHAMGVLA